MTCDMKKCLFCFCLLCNVTSHLDPNSLFVQVRMDWTLTDEESNLPIFANEAPLVKKKKKSELLEKLNANSKLLLEMKEDLERMKRDFYNRAAAQGFHEEQPTSSDAIELSGGRDDAPHVKAEYGHIEAENTSGAKVLTKAIDSEEILGDATNEIDEGVEVVVASELESADIGVASPSKTDADDVSLDAGNFGIEEAENTVEAGPCVEEEKTAEEHNDGFDSRLSEDALTIVEALAFVSQQLGDLEVDNTINRQMC